MKNEIDFSGVAHQSGTCRFGDDPKTLVLDRNCKAHELDNLYVADTSFFSSIGAVNPGLTAMANALRVGDHLLQRLGLTDRSPLDEACDFLLDLEAALHSVSVPADIADATDHARRRWPRDEHRPGHLPELRRGRRANIATGHEVRIKRIPFESHYDLWRTQELIELAQAMGDGRVGLAQGRERLARIKGQRALYSKGHRRAGLRRVRRRRRRAGRR